MFLPVMNQAQIESPFPKSLEATPLPRSREIKESQCLLTSVKNLRQSIIKGRHKRESTSPIPWTCCIYESLELTEIVEKHIFVGIVDIRRCLSLIQYSTNLYLANHDALAWVFIYFLSWGTDHRMTNISEKNFSTNLDCGNLEISVELSWNLRPRCEAW